jgi:hypothetical protein
MSILKRYAVQLDVEHMLVSAGITFLTGFLGAVVIQLPTLQENLTSDLVFSLLSGAFMAGIKAVIQISIAGVANRTQKK